MTLKIPADLLGDLRQHGESLYPEEAAAFLLGIHDAEIRQVVSIMPVANTFTLERRTRRYMIGPMDLLDAETEAERMGLDVVGVFHSHPDHPPEPSPFDLRWALPWLSYLITTIRKGSATESRSWRLAEDRTHMLEEQLISQPETEPEEVT